MPKQSGLQLSRTKMYLAELIEQEAVVAEGAGRARKYRLKDKGPCKKIYCRLTTN